MDVGRTPCVGMIGPRVGPWSDGDELVGTVLVGNRASSPGKIRIERRVVLLALVPITTARVGLPDLDQSVADWPAGLIEYPSTHDDALTDRFARVLGGTV